jgi:hypothetical protein
MAYKWTPEVISMHRDRCVMAAMVDVETFLSALDEIECCERKIAKFSKVLEFYANMENWQTDTWEKISIIGPPEYGNPGKLAREILKNNQ